MLRLVVECRKKGSHQGWKKWNYPWKGPHLPSLANLKPDEIAWHASEETKKPEKLGKCDCQIYLGLSRFIKITISWWFYPASWCLSESVSQSQGKCKRRNRISKQAKIAASCERWTLYSSRTLGTLQILLLHIIYSAIRVVSPQHIECGEFTVACSQTLKLDIWSPFKGFQNLWSSQKMQKHPAFLSPSVPNKKLKDLQMHLSKEITCKDFRTLFKYSYLTFPFVGFWTFYWKSSRKSAKFAHLYMTNHP